MKALLIKLFIWLAGSESVKAGIRDLAKRTDNKYDDAGAEVLIKALEEFRKVV